MLFSNMGFNFAHFSNFNFAHFKIEETFGLTWVKLQNGRFHFKNFHFGYLKDACFNYGLYFYSFCAYFGKSYHIQGFSFV